jgi:hypothetical protein
MKKELFYIKIAHTLIWLFYVFIIGYILYAGVYNKISLYLFIAIGFVFLEGIILMIFKGKCPLTVLGYNYTEKHEEGFDIFLPKWLAKYNKAIFGTIFIIGLLIAIYRISKM